MEKPKIEEIYIEAHIDTDPDTQFLGEYTTKENDWAICRACNGYLHDGDHSNCAYDPRVCEYFLPCAGGEEPGTEDYKKYGMQDYERMEAMERGEWNFIGIQARAIVSYPTSQGSRRLETLTSSGVWGVESDATKHHKEIAEGELAELKHHLEQFNVDTEDWDELVDGIEIKY